MADAPSNPNAMTVETTEAASQASSVNTVRRASASSKGEQSLSERPQGGSITVGGDPRDVQPNTSLEGGVGGPPADHSAAGGEGDAGGETPAAEDSGAGAEALADLGEFNPDDPEVAAKFDERYYTETGKLNEAALQQEWFGSVKKEGDVAALNPATYAYLESRLGLTKEVVDNYGRGLEALAEKQHQVFFDGAGGKERYSAAIAWAQGGGYTKEQQVRYNDQLTKGGQDAEDARDALMGRFGKVRTPKGGQEQRRGPPGAPEARNPANAKKDASRGGAGGSGGVQGFATKEDYTKAFRATRRDDNAAQAALRARLAASPEHVRRG